MTQIVTPPAFKFQFSPTTNPLSPPTWVDISSYVSKFSCQYGRQFELNRVEAGTASFTLDNTDRRFDPLNSSSPYYPNLLPMKKFQVTAPNTRPAGPNNLFTNPIAAVNTAGWFTFVATGTSSVARVATADTQGFGTAFDVTGAPATGGAIVFYRNDGGIVVTPGQVIYMSVWVKNISGPCSALGLAARGFSDSSGASLVAQDAVFSKASPIAGSWYFLNGAYTVPAGVGFVCPQLNISCTNGSTTVTRTTDFTGSFTQANTVTITNLGGEMTDASRTTATQGDGRAIPGGVGIWFGGTNLCTNGGFETNTTNWSPSGTNTIARSTTRSKFGTASALMTYNNGVGGDTNSGAFPLTLNANPWVCSAWVWVPTGYDGTGPVIQFEGFVGATNVTAVAADLTKRDQWQRITGTVNPVVGDLAGFVVARIGGGAAPTNGKFIFMDGIQVEQRTLPTPYIETNGSTATRQGGRIQAPTSLLNGPTQGWVAMRVRPEWSTTIEPYGGASRPYLFSFDDPSGYINAWYDETTNTAGIERNGTPAQVATQAWAPTVGTAATIVFAWTSTQLKISVNGAAFSTTNQSVITAITASVFDIGSPDGSGQQFNGEFHWVACGTGTLANADLAGIAALPDSLTSWSAANTEPTGDATMMSWPAASAVTMVWPCVDTSFRVPTTSYIWTGFIEQWPTTWEGPYWAQVDCTAVDGFEALSLADVSSKGATLTTALGGNTDITYTSVSVGAGNNSITITYVAAGSLSISVTGIAITVNYAISVSTANAVIAAINADPQASFLVSAALAPGSNGTGIIGFGAGPTYGPFNLSGGTYLQELTGSRINKVLDSISWPTGDRAIDTGQSTIVSRSFQVSDHQKAKTHINEIENSELGYVFIDGAGFVNYHDRAHRSTAALSTTSQGVFGDLAPELEYDDLVTNFDRTYVYNYIAISAADSNVAQVASDTTSIGQYLLRTFTSTTELVDSTAALGLAQFILLTYKQPALRFASMTITPMNDLGLWLQAFARTLGDRVTVIRRPPTHGATTGPALAADNFVESVSWTMNDGLIDTVVTYELSPSAYVTTGLKLDDATLGRLDNTNSLGL